MKYLAILLYILPFFSYAEEPPEAEYPYPSKKKVESNLEKPIKIDANGVYYYGPSKKKKSIKQIDGLEKAIKSGDDGSYYYDTKRTKKVKNHNGIEKPLDTDSDGNYYYKKSSSSKKSKSNHSSQQPSKILKDGTYIYNSDAPKAVSNTLYLRAGVYGPPKLQGATQSYENVYSNNSSWIINADYEWKMFDFLGEMLVKFGSGLSMENGSGQFSEDNNNGTEPKEKFQFILFPNTLALSYKLQMWDIQYLTPYIDAGVGYYTFWERRSDDKQNNFGGAPVLSFAGGLMISLSILGSGTGMANDYGIRQTWIDIQYKQVIGLDSRKDFSSNMITGGFALGL